MPKTKFDAQIEIDPLRGTMYVHLTDPKDIKFTQLLTAVRIQNVPARMFSRICGLREFIDVRMPDDA